MLVPSAQSWHITPARVLWNDSFASMPALAARKEHLAVTVMKRKSVRGGFSLIEMVIVVVLIAVLLAIAIPHFMRARESSRSKACTQNLRSFEMAKQQWAIASKAPSSATPTASELVTEYIKGTEDTLPLCPSGGTYSLNDLPTIPSCSVGNNGTPEKRDDHILE